MRHYDTLVGGGIREGQEGNQVFHPDQPGTSLPAKVSPEIRYEAQREQTKTKYKMADLNHDIPIITLNLSGLNSLFKRQRLTE